MKQMRLFAALIAALLLAACSAPTLEKQVEQAASHCPVEVKGVGFIKNISLDKDTLVYDVTVTSPSIDLSRLSSRPDEVKATMKSSIVNLFDNNHEMLDALRENAITLQIRYVDRNRASLTLNFSPDDLKAEPSRKASPQEELEAEIQRSKILLPAELAPSVMITDISDTENMIMFHCEVDETTANADAIDNLRAHSAEIAAEMAKSLSGSADPDVKRMVGIAMRADHGIAYRYTGSVSGDTVTIAFPASRLRMMR